jgi:hypothetical protein
LVAVRESLEQQADAVLAFTNSGVPDFISDAVLDAIEEAAWRTGFPAPTYAPEEKDARRILADLFSQTRHLSLRACENSLGELARLITAVLRHPLLPFGIYDDLSRSVAELNTNNAWEDRQYVEAVLRSHGSESEAQS